MISRRHSLGFVLAVLAVGGMAPARADDKYRKLAPYTSVRWSGDSPEVEIEGRFFGWRGIDGIGIERLIAFARETYGRIWKKRLSEDLVQVMTEFGQAPRERVVLRIQDPSSKSEVVERELAMTRENRQKVWAANQRSGI